MTSILAILDFAFPRPDLDGKQTREVIHPQFGKVDRIIVSGDETPEQITAYEAAVFARLFLPI